MGRKKQYKKCAICGTEFQSCYSDNKSTCSNTCSMIYRKKIYNRPYRECVICGANFRTVPSDKRKTCSSVCQTTFRRQSKPPKDPVQLPPSELAGIFKPEEILKRHIDFWVEVRKAMKEKKISLTDIANELGMNRNTIYKYSSRITSIAIIKNQKYIAMTQAAAAHLGIDEP